MKTEFAVLMLLATLLLVDGCVNQKQNAEKRIAGTSKTQVEAKPKTPDDYARVAKLLSSVSAKSRKDFENGYELLQTLRMNAASRKPVLSRPHVFVRSQTKYSGRLYRNYYLWHDRPLFGSRKLWDNGESDHKFASFKKTFELYESYGLDGFATFAWPGDREYKRTMKVIYDTAARMKLNPKKFNIMLEVSAGPKYLNICDATLGLIEKNPYSFRINGKSVISSYQIDRLSPEKLKSYIDKLRERSNGGIIFLPQIHFISFKDENGKNRLSVQAIQSIWKLNGKVLPASTLLRMMEYLRGYLRVCDGL